VLPRRLLVLVLVLLHPLHCLSALSYSGQAAAAAAAAGASYEAELLPLMLAHGLIRRVRTIQIHVRPLGGDSFKFQGGT
jgi:hypothetical protein